MLFYPLSIKIVFGKKKPVKIRVIRIIRVPITRNMTNRFNQPNLWSISHRTHQPLHQQIRHAPRQFVFIVRKKRKFSQRKMPNQRAKQLVFQLHIRLHSLGDKLRDLAGCTHRNDVFQLFDQMILPYQKE